MCNPLNLATLVVNNTSIMWGEAVNVTMGTYVLCARPATFSQHAVEAIVPATRPPVPHSGAVL